MSSIFNCLELTMAKEELESLFNVGPVGNSAISPTGEEYVEICSGGIRKECEPLPAWFSSQELAVEFWRRSVTEYADSIIESDNKTLYWRIVPELGELLYTEAHLGFPEYKSEIQTLYSVYSRLLISSKPALKSAA